MTGGPNDKPAFLDPQRAESIGYVGAGPDSAPTFDDELAAWNDPGPPEDSVDPEDTQIPIQPDSSEAPSAGYRERWRAIARMHALGHTNNQIARRLGYTAAGLSRAIRDPWVQSEITRYRQQYETDITSRVKEAALDGIERIHAIIRDDREKTTTVLDASKWAVEKASGKARQEVTVQDGNLTSFMELLREMQRRGDPIDVTPGAPALGPSPAAEAESQPADRWIGWISENLR